MVLVIHRNPKYKNKTYQEAFDMPCTDYREKHKFAQTVGIEKCIQSSTKTVNRRSHYSLNGIDAYSHKS